MTVFGTSFEGGENVGSVVLASSERLDSTCEAGGGLDWESDKGG